MQYLRDAAAQIPALRAAHPNIDTYKTYQDLSNALYPIQKDPTAVTIALNSSAPELLKLDALGGASLTSILIKPEQFDLALSIAIKHWPKKDASGYYKQHGEQITLTQAPPLPIDMTML